MSSPSYEKSASFLSLLLSLLSPLPAKNLANCLVQPEFLVCVRHSASVAALLARKLVPDVGQSLSQQMQVLLLALTVSNMLRFEKLKIQSPKCHSTLFGGLTRWQVSERAEREFECALVVVMGEFVTPVVVEQCHDSSQMQPGMDLALMSTAAAAWRRDV